MTKRKVKPAVEIVPEPEFTITGPVTDVVVTNETTGEVNHAPEWPAPDYEPPALQDQVVGDEVIYVDPSGSRYPAVIVERYGTHSALAVEALKGTLAEPALESVRYDAGKAAGTYHFGE